MQSMSNRISGKPAPLSAVLALVVVSLAKGDGAAVTLDKFTWDLSDSEGIQFISCSVVNNLSFPITSSTLTLDFYAADGTKIGERLVLMELVPAGQRVLYSLTFMPEYESMARPAAYVKIEKLEGNVQGARYSVLPPEGIPEVWNPYIVAARLRAEAKAMKQAEKERKKAEKAAGKSKSTSP
jgi:hypothetical protein